MLKILHNNTSCLDEKATEKIRIVFSQDQTCSHHQSGNLPLRGREILPTLKKMHCQNMMEMGIFHLAHGAALAWSQESWICGWKVAGLISGVDLVGYE